MAQIAEAWAKHQRRRWMRPDAYRWLRPDANRWLRPDADRWIRVPLSDCKTDTNEGPIVCLESLDQLHAAATRLRWSLAAENVLLKARRFRELYKPYNPNQPRVPAGNPEGGQWTEGGSPGAVRLAASDKTPFARAGPIGIVLQLGKRLIDAYRSENLLRDFFGQKVGTAAVTSLDDKYIYGFNSGISEYSGQYTDRDEAIANELRQRMLERYPRVMASDNIGSKPNDALYHAETTVLLRAARENGGTLQGKNLIVIVDGPMCFPSCPTLLPYVGLELGNPTVTFVDDAGRTRTMKNGKWDD